MSMAENDIYNNERIYDYFRQNFQEFAQKPKPDAKRKYYCGNKTNLKYFLKLFSAFEAKDISFARRNRLIQSFRLICHATKSNLSKCGRSDIDKIVSFMHTVYKSPKSKSDFIRDIKHMWKILFPEIDEKGNEDETIVPYPVRHLRSKIDKSKEKLRNDRLTFEEFEKILSYFSKDPRMQAYIILAQESLGRPQEILYTKIKDVELYDNYAKIYIAEHGKEGCGFMQCIDSYPYLIKWLEVHPFKKDPKSFLFINIGNKKTGAQLCPININMMLNKACKDLGLDKTITCYSLKRNGVTFRRLRGESDVEIQHVARWTSTRQLKTYDYSDQEDVLRKQLIRKGLLKPDKKNEELTPAVKTCNFCGARTGFTETFCPNCRRPMNREHILEQERQNENTISAIREELNEIRNHLSVRREYDDDLKRLLMHPEVIQIYKSIYRKRIA